VAFDTPGTDNPRMSERTADRDRVVTSLAAVPDRLASAARAAAPEPPAPGEWTPAQVVRHLIAVEREVWQPRLAQLAAEDHPRWPWVEPEPWSGEPDATLDRLLERYAETRSSTVTTLAALDDAGWSRTGTHATFGILDVTALMVRAIDHDEEHLASFSRG
jgi:hypothetical protein